MIFSIEEILRTFGYFALFGFVFAESGLFFGFFLPGDSLLFTAGILAANGHLNIYTIILGSIICAFLGDQVGYWTGKRFGAAFFSKPDSFFRKPVYMEKAEQVLFEARQESNRAGQVCPDNAHLRPDTCRNWAHGLSHIRHLQCIGWYFLVHTSHWMPAIFSAISFPNRARF